MTDPRTGTLTIGYYREGTGRQGRRQSVTDAAGNTVIYDYSPETGRKISERNALGKLTRYGYNSYGQVTELWGESGYPLHFSYDARGRQISQTTYRSASVDFAGLTFPGVAGDETRWSYDAGSGLVVAKTHPDGRSTAYAYRADGKLLTRRWARGIETAYAYDPATGELRKAAYSDGTPPVERTYNRLGQLASVTDAAGTRTFAYDAAFNRVSETIGGIYAKTLSYHYAQTGVKGRLSGFSLDNVINSAYSYDEYGRLNGVNGIAYGRLANSELIENITRPNGVNTVFGYEAK